LTLPAETEGPCPKIPTKESCSDVPCAYTHAYNVVDHISCDVYFETLITKFT